MITFVGGYPAEIKCCKCEGSTFGHPDWDNTICGKCSSALLERRFATTVAEDEDFAKTERDFMDERDFYANQEYREGI